MYMYLFMSRMYILGVKYVLPLRQYILFCLFCCGDARFWTSDPRILTPSNISNKLIDLKQLH